MNLYILTRNIDIVGYDEYDGKVVAAPTEEDARRIANWDTGDEGRIWADCDAVICRKVDLKNESQGVLLASFNAG